MHGSLAVYPDGNNVFVVAQTSDTGLGRHLRWVEATQGPIPIVNAMARPTPLLPSPVPVNSLEASSSSSSLSSMSTLSSISSSSGSSSMISPRYVPDMEHDTASAVSSQSSRGPLSVSGSYPSRLGGSLSPLIERGDEPDPPAAKDFIHGDNMEVEDVKPTLPINPLLSGTLSSFTSMPSTSSFSSSRPQKSPVTPRRGLQREGAIWGDAFSGAFAGSSTDASTSSGASSSWSGHSLQASTSQWSCHQPEEPLPMPIDMSPVAARSSSSSNQGPTPRTPRRRTHTAQGSPGKQSHPSSSSPTSPGPIRHRPKWQRNAPNNNNNNKTTPRRLQRLPTFSPPPASTSSAPQTTATSGVAQSDSLFQNSGYQPRQAYDRAWSVTTEIVDETEQYRTGDIPGCTATYPGEWVVCSSNGLTTHPTEPLLNG